MLVYRSDNGPKVVIYLIKFFVYDWTSLYTFIEKTNFVYSLGVYLRRKVEDGSY